VGEDVRNHWMGFLLDDEGSIYMDEMVVLHGFRFVCSQMIDTRGVTHSNHSPFLFCAVFVRCIYQNIW